MNDKTVPYQRPMTATEVLLRRIMGPNSLNSVQLSDRLYKEGLRLTDMEEATVYDIKKIMIDHNVTAMTSSEMTDLAEKIHELVYGKGVAASTGQGTLDV